MMRSLRNPTIDSITGFLPNHNQKTTCYGSLAHKQADPQYLGGRFCVYQV